MRNRGRGLVLDPRSGKSPFLAGSDLKSVVYDDNGTSKLRLNNGLTLLSQQLPHLRSVSVGAWVMVGSRSEKAEDMGICHFIEHAVFKGTRHRNALEIAKSLESVGGTLNAFTGKEQTCYYANILHQDLPLAIRVIADLVTNASFRESDIEKEKQVILEEIKDAEDTPEEFVQDRFYEDVFRDHPLGFRILGSEETIKGLKSVHLKRFYSQNYAPSNIVLSVVGNFETDALYDIAEREFKFNKKIDGYSWPDNLEKYRFQAASGKPDNVLTRNIGQAHVCMGVPLTVTYASKKKFEWIAFNTILGGGMSSRLFQRIREKSGLAYSVYSFVDFMVDGGLFGIYLATDKSKVKKACDNVRSEINRFLSSPIKAHELKMAKAQIKASLLFGLESTSTRMIRLAKNEIYFKKSVGMDTITNQIDRIKLDDVQDVAESLASKLDHFQSTMVL